MDEAIREGRQAVDLVPVSLDALDGPFYLEDLAEIYTIVGEHDEALNLIEDLLHRPGMFGIHELVNSRDWDPLRDHPSYAELVGMYGGNL